MYLDELPALQARLYAYQEQTRNLELVWREPAPVPTPLRSRRYDYYFTWGRFEAENGTSLAIFSKNPSRRVDLRHSRSFMLVTAPFGTLEDILVIFESHIEDKGMLTVADKIKVIRGIEAELEWAKPDAERFNFFLNKEIAILFSLAVQSAQARVLSGIELELSLLSQLEYRD